jgi:hypothetical protein
MGTVIIVGLLILIVFLLGGGNIVIGAVAFPILAFGLVYVWGLNGFIVAVVFLGLLPAIPLILGLFGVAHQFSRRVPKTEEAPLELGKVCYSCDRKVMNAAVKCPQCGGKLSRRI